MGRSFARVSGPVSVGAATGPQQPGPSLLLKPATTSRVLRRLRRVQPCAATAWGRADMQLEGAGTRQSCTRTVSSIWIRRKGRWPLQTPTPSRLLRTDASPGRAGVFARTWRGVTATHTDGALSTEAPSQGVADADERQVLGIPGDPGVQSLCACPRVWRTPSP